MIFVIAVLLLFCLLIVKKLIKIVKILIVQIKINCFSFSFLIK